MSNPNNWMNEMRATSGKLIEVMDAIDALYNEMINSANRYHNLKYATQDPPVVPAPAKTIEEKLKQWLNDPDIAGTGYVGEFPDMTEDDYWQLALALNTVRTGLNEDQEEAVYWGAQ